VRWLKPALAGALLMALVPAIAAAGNPGDELAACRSQKDGKPQITLRGDRWVRINAPKFDADEGPSRITAFATTPRRANGIYVTNGTVVKISDDAGCTWTTLYRGNDLHAPVEPYTTDTFTNLTAPTDSTLWLASYDDIGGAPHPHVYVGTDVGAPGKTPAFGQVDIGLPAYGKPVTLIASAMAGSEAYLLLDELPDPAAPGSLTPSRHLYTTYVPNNPPEAGAVTGLAWEEITPPSGFGRIDGVTRQDNRSIWIWSGDRYAYGAQVNTSPIDWQVGTAAGPIVTVDVSEGGAAAVVAKTAQGTTIDRVDAHGRAARWGGVPVQPVSFTHGEREDVYVASGSAGTWGFDHRVMKWVDVTPRGVAAFTQLQMANGTTGRIVLGLTPEALYRWDTYRGETFIEPPPPPAGVGDPDNPVIPKSKLKDAVLTPTRQVVTVAPGKAHDVPVTFRVPPAPTPLDVYFLVDTTYSMGPAILGLRKAISRISADIRSRLGISACFGVGDVKDLSADSPYVFKTLLPVACDPTLKRVDAAVAQLKEVGGGDTDEAQTVGLSQAVTGTGQTYIPIPAGQGAGFRPGAFKVIVLISDAPSHEGSGYPTLQQAAATLNVADVKVVSIAVNDGQGNLHGAESMMRALAKATQSMSPPAGVDCNGDGGGYYGDLGPGEPLVCEVTATGGLDGSERVVNIGPAIIGLLLAVKDPGTIAVDVDDPNGVVRRPIRGVTSVIKDLKYENALHFTMSVECSPAQDGRDLVVGLLPTVRSSPIGLFGEVLVRCRSVPPLPVVPPPVLPDVVHVAPPARPLLGIAPVPPAPPNAPPQPISNINPNAGLTHEEEQQSQLALVTQDAAEGEAAEELEMSQLGGRRRDMGTGPLAIGAAVLLTATAFAHQRRTQRQIQLGHDWSRT
jgi:hypothetical protein